MGNHCSSHSIQSLQIYLFWIAKHRCHVLHVIFNYVVEMFCVKYLMPFKGKLAYVELDGVALLIDKNNYVIRTLPAKVAMMEYWFDQECYLLQNEDRCDLQGNMIEPNSIQSVITQKPIMTNESTAVRTEIRTYCFCRYRWFLELKESKKINLCNLFLY